ncbi:MAG: hypothetical protein WBX25_20190, partial [Rhodomicrobium sp.]
RRHGGEQRLSDDAPGPDASVLLPYCGFSLYLGGLGLTRNLVFALVKSRLPGSNSRVGARFHGGLMSGANGFVRL